MKKIKVPTILRIIPKRKEKSKDDNKGNYPRKKSHAAGLVVGSDRRTREVSRREISKNFSKMQRTDRLL